MDAGGSGSPSCVRRFTIVEMIVVTAVIMVLMSMLVAAVSKTREKAKMGRWEGYMRNERVSEQQILQLMFMEGNGTLTENLAQGIDVEGYERNKYDGYLGGTTTWDKGRWFRKKGIRMMNGMDSLEVAYQNIVDKDSGEFTIILWVYPRVMQSQGLVNTQRESSPGVWEDGDYPNLLLNATNTLGIAQDEVSIFAAASELTLPTEKWSMVALVQRVDEGVYLYRFGEGGEKGKELISAMPFGNPADGRGRTFFGNSDGLSGAFDGVIDELVIYRRALNDTALEGHFKMGQP